MHTTAYDKMHTRAYDKIDFWFVLFYMLFVIFCNCEQHCMRDVDLGCDEPIQQHWWGYATVPSRDVYVWHLCEGKSYHKDHNRAGRHPWIWWPWGVWSAVHRTVHWWLVWLDIGAFIGCIQFLEILEIYWNLISLLEMLEISWNLIDPPGKFDLPLLCFAFYFV